MFIFENVVEKKTLFNYLIIQYLNDGHSHMLAVKTLNTLTRSIFMTIFCMLL